MIRVLHVVENFNGQAVESWLTRLLTFDGFDFESFHFDFFLIGVGQGRQAGVVSALGCRIFLGNPGGASIPQMAKSLRRHVRNGAYDVVHIHQDVLSGVLALALLGTGVKVVTHVHNCWQRLPVGGRLKERVLTAVARELTLRLSCAIVGVSKQALLKMTGGSVRRKGIDRVIHCSAKSVSRALQKMDCERISAEVRQQFNMPASAKLMLFLGRLDEYKNPGFALKVLVELIASGVDSVYLVIAGQGGLEQQLRDSCAKDCIHERVRMVGWVADPSCLLLASDLLLMPSQEWCGEGLGLAAVEAQGCGVPVLCSLSIPEEAAIIPDLFQRISLGGGAWEWARVAFQSFRRKRPALAICLSKLEQSVFTDSASSGSLMELYSMVVFGHAPERISGTPCST